MRGVILVLSLALGGCYASHQEPLEPLECEVDPCPLFRSEPGRAVPQGRVDACEACGSTEGEIQARQVELGCPLTAAHGACTLTGACSWAALLDHWETIRSASTCGELAQLAEVDPCTRPDPALYWTADGGCGSGWDSYGP